MARMTMRCQDDGFCMPSHGTRQSPKLTRTASAVSWSHRHPCSQPNPDHHRRSPRVLVRANPAQTPIIPTFIIPPIDPNVNVVSDKETLACPHIRDELTPRPSPFVKSRNFDAFVSDEDRVALNTLRLASKQNPPAYCHNHEMDLQTPDDLTVRHDCIPLPPWAIRAGPRDTVYFDAETVNAAIVTCGGLCPGLNDVVQGIVRRLLDYGVPPGQVLGIRYGFRGFYDPEVPRPLPLVHANVDGVEHRGGTMLGTSRGGADISTIVSKLEMWGIKMLFVIGGDGGNRGAMAIHELCRERKVQCCVIGLPKSIDNDILLIDATFGFQTAVEEAQRALLAAKVEASSAWRGVGLVKIMGRSSGFIAMQASLASGVVDVCLIPEVPFKLQGETGLIRYVASMVEQQGHCVICVAEGAGQELMREEVVPARDASGNIILKDIGRFLKDQLRAATKNRLDVKLIDPTYQVRAIVPNSVDHIYCRILAQNAVDAAFSGYSGVSVGQVSGRSAVLPIQVLIQAPKRVDPLGSMWTRLRAANSQPDFV